jgi:hypothetical protein
MTIPVSSLIDVTIAISPNAIGTNGYGPLLFASQEFKPAADELPIQIFNSMDEVESKYPSGEVYNAATTYYSQRPKPKTFIACAVGDIGSDATAATLVGRAATLDNLTGITSGSLTLKVSGVEVSVSDIDLSGCDDLDEVLAAIGDQLPGTVKLEQADGVYTISTVAKGSTATLSYCDSSSLADALGLTIQGGTLTNGSDGTTITSYLTSALNAGTFFYFVALDRKFRDTEVMIEAARWCEANSKYFGYASSDANMLIGGADSQAKDIVASNLMRTQINYCAKDTDYLEVSAIARLSTVNFNQSNSAITLAYKDMPGVTIANIDSSQLSALESINANAFMSVGGVGIYYDGRMANGTWADTVQGVDWLQNQVQTNLFNLFYQTQTKVPFTDTGISMVNQAVAKALQLAVTNGLIGPGYDSEGNFYPKGYKVISTSIEDLLEEKGARVWQGTSFVAIGTGALQGVAINGTFTQ